MSAKLRILNLAATQFDTLSASAHHKSLGPRVTLVIKSGGDVLFIL